MRLTMRRHRVNTTFPQRHISHLSESKVDRNTDHIADRPGLSHRVTSLMRRDQQTNLQHRLRTNHNCHSRLARLLCTHHRLVFSYHTSLSLTPGVIAGPVRPPSGGVR